MPNFSGVWTLSEQLQAVSDTNWTGFPLYELYAWGENNCGEAGISSLIRISSPVQVGTEDTWLKVRSGGRNVAAIKTNGTLWTWGYNGKGVLGHIDTICRSSPVQVGALTNWSQASIGSHAMAIKTDGTLWGWGNNTGGALGNNISYPTAGSYRSSPIQIGSSTWSYVSPRLGGGTIAIQTNGTLWSWGQLGPALGTGTCTARSSPVQIGALTNWYAVVESGGSALAIKTDNTMWGWGCNTSFATGILGFSTGSDVLSPVQVGALSNWKQADITNSCAAGAVKTDGTLWMWGQNSQGQLGLNLSVICSRSSPVQVGALTNWSCVSVGGSVAAIKTDRTLWNWGHNNIGQLGNNTLVSRSSPVQLGALRWNVISAAGGSQIGTTFDQTN